MKAAAAAVPVPAMPPELKARLREAARQAARRREARRRLSWLRGLREALRGSGRPWRLGLAAGLAAAVVAVVLGTGGGAESVPVDEMLAAHRAYALTMPLTSHEMVLSGLADALAGARQ